MLGNNEINSLKSKHEVIKWKKVRYEIEVNGSLRDGKRFYNAPALLHIGHPLPDPYKSWKEVGVLSHNIGNLYNPSIMTIYKAKDGSYRYEIYRDGSIYAFYGRIEFNS